MLTPSGAREIRELAEHEEVWSDALRQGASCPGQILSISRHEADVLVVVELANESLRCTSEHPFYVVDYGWVPAGELSADDTLLNYRGTLVPIIGLSTEVNETPVEVFNMHVDTYECYFVGQSGVLVHNKPR